VENFAAHFRKVNDLITKQYRTGEVQYISTIAESLSEQVPVAAMPIPGPPLGVASSCNSQAMAIEQSTTNAALSGGPH